MKIYLCFAILLIKCCYSKDTKYNLKDPGYYNDYYYSPRIVGVGSGYPEQLERPCRIYDIYCIRKYFAEHSSCTKVYGPVPDEIYKAQMIEHIPRVNITLNEVNIRYLGLNGRITEFYVNKITNNLVLAVELSVKKNAQTVFLRYHRRAREPIVTSDYINITYNSLISTIVIPNAKDIKLEDGEVVSYVNDLLPPFELGPGLFNNEDPEFRLAIAELVAGVPINVREVQLSEAAFYMATYIQCNICDFGIKIP